jgi:plastocyanin
MKMVERMMNQRMMIQRMMRQGVIVQRITICALLLCAARLPAQVTTVRGRVEVIGGRPWHPASVPATVVWLTPQPGSAYEAPKVTPRTDGTLRLVQKNKSFEPHILVVPVGSVVEFPNLDPFFHNVFSLFEGKRFDLGLYEAGTSHVVKFDRAGISYIFCNIHPEMSAVVVALNTPYYGISGASGDVKIRNVLPGAYRLQAWHERSSLDVVKGLSREVMVSAEQHSLGTIRLPESTDLMARHKNKYSKDYIPPNPPGSLYEQP